jgi:hypothetical protein
MLVLHLTSHHWWWIMAVPFLCAALTVPSGRRGFVVGMTSGGLLWLSGAAYKWITGADIIAARVAVMMGVGSPWIVLLATVLTAVVAAGFAGGAGYYARAVFRLRRPGG